jgi:lipid II:glycine glycyltransferase (peptidoglycan interpeptide bridge formation enzyme)
MFSVVDEWADPAAWDAFVRVHPQSRYCQLFGYGRVVSCYGYRPHYLAFRRNGELVGVLPAAEVSSMLYRRRLVSQPFSEYGGILLHPELSSEDVQAALQALQRYLGQSGGFPSLEIHGNHGLGDMPRTLTRTQDPVGHIAFMQLTPDADALWRNVLKPAVRNKVRQAHNNGVTVSFKNDETTLRQDFFPLYLKSMKRLGVPPHKFAYYARSLAEFGNDMHLAIARAPNGAPIAGLLGFACGNRVRSIINTVSDADYWHLRANDLLHWDMIRWTAESGHQIFDFGSVRYEGQSTYKRKWGTELADHHNYLLSAETNAAGKAVINSSSRGMQRMSQLWSALVPDAVKPHLGPIIRGQLAR